MLPVALMTPVTYAPVLANCAMLLVPLTPTVTLPLVATTTLLLPFKSDDPADTVIPVNNAPLPTK